MELLNKIPFEKTYIKLKEKLGRNVFDMFFIVPFAVIILSYGITMSSLEGYNLETVFSALRYITLLCALAKIYLFCAYKTKELLAISIFVLILGLSGIKGGDKTLFFSAVMILASKGTDLKKICKYAFFATTFAVAVTVGLCALKILPDSIQMRGDTLVRHSYGFAHPNALGLWVMMAFSEFYCAYEHKLNFACYALTVAAAFAVYKITNSRASFAVLMLLAVLSPTIKYMCKKPQSEKILKKIFIFAIAAIGILSVVLMVAYNPNNKLISTISKVVSNRIYLGNLSFKEYGLTIFGNSSFMQEMKMPVVDCVYMKTSLTTGIISLLSLIYLQCKSASKAFGSHMAVLALVCLLWAAYGTMEIYTYDVFFNVSLLAASIAKNKNTVN